MSRPERPRRAVAAAAVVIVMVQLAAGCGRGPAEDPDAMPAATTTSMATTSTSLAPPASTVAPTTDTAAPTTAAPGRRESLQATVDDYAGRQPVPFGVVAVDFATGERAERLGDRKVLSASFYKLFVARELFRRIYEGSLDRESQAGDGRGRTWGQCLTDMIVVSDDPCGVAGLKAVGRGGHDHALAAAGYRNTTLSSPQQTSAADVALFFERARSGTLLGPGGEAPSAELWDLLRRQQVRDRFPRGLPPGTPIAHKTGDRTGWAHDGGVFTTPNGDVLLVAMTGQWASPCCHAESPGPPEERAFTAIAGLAAAVYDYAV